MNLVYILVSFILLSYLLISYYKKQRTYLLSKKLQSVYDMMELNFIQNSKTLNNEEIDFIKVYKHIATNTQLLDIHLLIISKLGLNASKMKVSKQNFEKMSNSQDAEFKKLTEHFDEIANSLMKMSLYNSTFILFIIRIFVFHTIHKGQYNIIAGYQRFRNDLNYVLKNENVLIQQQMSPC